MKKPNIRMRYAAVATVIFLIADNLAILLRYLDLKRFVPSLLVLGFRNFLEVLLCFVGISVAHRFGFKRSARELGLKAPVGRALLFASIASLPMLVAFAATSGVNAKMTFLSVGVGCFIAPFAEEILFRSFMFRQLYRRARVGFWLSALLPSVLFALGHLYQSDDFWELIGIVAITGLGGLLSCWIFIRWQDNLWAIFGLHSLMNLWWEVFAVDDTALGGWLANAARLATVGLAVILTIYKDRIWKPLPIEAENISMVKERKNESHNNTNALSLAGPALA
jgi:membrane protease YdiL (CAAX protease family)